MAKITAKYEQCSYNKTMHRCTERGRQQWVKIPQLKIMIVEKLQLFFNRSSAYKYLSNMNTSKTAIM